MSLRQNKLSVSATDEEIDVLSFFEALELNKRQAYLTGINDLLLYGLLNRRIFVLPAFPTLDSPFCRRPSTDALLAHTSRSTLGFRIGVLNWLPGNLNVALHNSDGSRLSVL